jgi:hypothetical protein
MRRELCAFLLLILGSWGAVDTHAQESASRSWDGGDHGSLLPLPTGQLLSPTAAPGSTFAPLNPELPGLPSYTAGQAVTTAVSPDGRTLLVLTSGYNLEETASAADNPALTLNNGPGNGLTKGIAALGIAPIVGAEAAGLAVSADGSTVVVANYENDSICPPAPRSPASRHSPWLFKSSRANRSPRWQTRTPCPEPVMNSG